VNIVNNEEPFFGDTANSPGKGGAFIAIILLAVEVKRPWLKPIIIKRYDLITYFVQTS
jgi:hypothetical protein